MIEIRKTIILRETVFSELGVEAARPITRAVGMAVIRNPLAGQFVEDLKPLFERPSVPNVEAWYRRLQERPAYREHIMVPFGELYGRLDY